MSKPNKTGALITGLTIGGALGTLIGLLIAPRTGKETRKVIKKSADALPELAEDLSTSIQLQAHRLSEEALVNWEETLTRLRTAIAAGMEASQLEREKIKTIDTTPTHSNFTENSSIPSSQSESFRDHN